MGNQRRLLSLLGLPPTVVRTLELANFLFDDDVRELSPTELMQASGATVAECCEVLKAVTAAADKPLTVLDMIEHSPAVGSISTCSSALDQVLGGGLPLSALTEVAGTPGIGKTQLGLQACVSVQLPPCLGGVGGEAVIIDAEGSVSATRLREMAEYTVAHCSRACSSQQTGGGEGDLKDFTVENILKRIHYYRCLNQLSVVSCIKLLPSLLQSHPSIRLVLLDSIAFHLRHDVPDNRLRTGLLCSMTQDLIQLATSHKLAVMVTNQMTTRVGGGTTALVGGGEGELVPALGESWGHCPTLRLVLRWQGGVRTARLLKAPHRANGEAAFQVTAAGMRDVEESITDGSMGEHSGQPSPPRSAGKRNYADHL